MEKPYGVNLTIPEVNLIFKALGKLPAEESMDLILNLDKQMSTHLKAKPDADA